MLSSLKTGDKLVAKNDHYGITKGKEYTVYAYGGNKVFCDDYGMERSAELVLIEGWFNLVCK